MNPDAAQKLPRVVIPTRLQISKHLARWKKISTGGTKALVAWIDEFKVAAGDLHLLQDGRADDSEEESLVDDSDVVDGYMDEYGGATTGASRNSNDGETVADGTGKMEAVGISGVEVVGDDDRNATLLFNLALRFGFVFYLIEYLIAFCLGATTVEDWVILLGTVQPGQGEGMLFIFRLSCSLLRKEKAGIQLQAEEFDFMAAAGDLDEIEEVNANCILMANLQQASTSGTQHDRAPIYDTDGSAEVVQICLWYVDSGCSKHMTGNIKLLINFVWKFLGTVRFGNDHISAILGYGDLKWGNITIIGVYFVEGLGHNLFSVGQFCDADLEVAFRRNTCFIRDLDGVDLSKDDYSRYTWVHFIRTKDETLEVIKNFLKKIYIRLQAPVIMVRTDNETEFKNHALKEYFDSVGITLKTSAAKTPQENGVVERKNRTLVEAARTMLISSHAPLFLWLKKPDISYLHVFGALCYLKNDGEDIDKLGAKAHVIIVRTDNGTEFKNQVLKEYFDSVGITHENSAAKTPQQNGSVERKNRTLVEATITMLIFSHAPLFLWAEAIATVCYTQNHSIIHRRFNKTPYELIQGRKPDISYLRVFRVLCYPKNDREDIGKLGEKGDIGFFIGYSANSVAYRVYNRRTRKIMETMNVTFDELSAMAFEQNSSRPGLQSMTSRQISSELKLTYAPSTITPQRPSERDLDILFEPLHNEYLSGRPSEAPRTIHVAPMQQRNHSPSPTASAADNVLNAMFE
nr:hypothetical protein [Tanacetum cinerariifolium]